MKIDERSGDDSAIDSEAEVPGQDQHCLKVDDKYYEPDVLKKMHISNIFTSYTPKFQREETYHHQSQ